MQATASAKLARCFPVVLVPRVCVSRARSYCDVRGVLWNGPRVTATPVSTTASASRYSGPLSRQIGALRSSTTATSETHVGSTIFALSSAPGRAAIAIVRISGPACIEIYQALCPGRRIPKPRVATIRTLYDPTEAAASARVLDSEALVLFFPAPNTVTGEDVLELHVHGGPATVKAVLDAIPLATSHADRSSSVRYAEPGEFTRRAFYNSRLDLTQIESLGETLAAETEQQRRLAVRGTRNPLANRYEEWRTQLLYARGELEALIDFSEDQHLDESPTELVSSISGQVLQLQRQITLHIQNASKGELLRRGITIALLGAPNAGKSSLLNRIVGREAAIVSSEEGTTRDIVDVNVDLGGYFCRLGDMAGLRARASSPSANISAARIGEIEKEGMRRAKARALDSDVVIVVLSIEALDAGGYDVYIEDEVLEAVKACVEANKAIVVAVNKCDRLPATNGLQTDHAIRLVDASGCLTTDFPLARVFPISCLEASDPGSTAEDPGNIQAFLGGLQKTFEELALPSSIDGSTKDAAYWEDSLGVTQRQSLNLRQCNLHLQDFLLQTSSVPAGADQDDFEVDVVAAAEHLRSAADCLAKITGKGEAGDVEEVLGVVFEKFCVGK